MGSRLGLLLALVVLLAGCSAPTASPRPAATSGEPVHPPDPARDRLGWEGGYWYNETIAIDDSDGVDATERRALVRRAMARVEHIRGQEFERTIPVEVISRETYRTTYGGGNRSSDRSFTRFDNAKFEALFLIGSQEDSLGVQDENRGTNVLGFYSSRNESIIVVAADGDALPGETTLAHELVHALQDQHVGLENFSQPTRERYNAVNGLIEGDATLVGQTYTDRCEAAWDCYVPPSEGAGTGGGGEIHFGVYFLNYFPYSDGPSFVSYWRDRGGWERVDALYDAPPASTEQVIYPDRYGVDTPRNVTLVDRPRNGWERVRLSGRVRARPSYAVLGQSALSAMFAYTFADGYNPEAVIDRETFINTDASGRIDRSDPFNYDLAYTNGWDGDRLHVYKRGEETAYVWRLVWDSPGDAEEFASGYRALLRHWGGERVEPGVWRIDDGPFADAYALRVDGETVTIVNAPTEAALGDVRPPA